ncbi:hypothetical protein DEJ05_13230 [Curtobacterium sp. MCLR17_045]|nr:hypothetical protein DEJ05_13230 [Curtobacterium sp. MCLR17_045]
MSRDFGHVPPPSGHDSSSVGRRVVTNRRLAAPQATVCDRSPRTPRGVATDRHARRGRTICRPTGVGATDRATTAMRTRRVVRPQHTRAAPRRTRPRQR